MGTLPPPPNIAAHSFHARNPTSAEARAAYAASGTLVVLATLLHFIHGASAGINCASATVSSLGYPKGSLAAYTLAKEDTCLTAAKNLGISFAKLDRINREILGVGCQLVKRGDTICYPKGSLPPPSHSPFPPPRLPLIPPPLIPFPRRPSPSPPRPLSHPPSKPSPSPRPRNPPFTPSRPPPSPRPRTSPASPSRPASPPRPRTSPSPPSLLSPTPRPRPLHPPPSRHPPSSHPRLPPPSRRRPPPPHPRKPPTSPPAHPPSPAQAQLLQSIASAWTVNGQKASTVLGWTSLDACDGSYTGVSCHSGTVTSLDLSGKQLSGSIPSSFRNLISLEILWLGSNQLSGSIPDSLGSLFHIQDLRLDNNQLLGKIPDSFGKLSNLTWIDMWNNQLSGSIPDSLGSLTNLVAVGLGFNQFSGGLPDSLGNLTNLQSLKVDNNHLSGTIPNSFGNLINLQALFLHGNQLSGSIPETFGNLINMQILKLNNNQLSGWIPDSLENMTSLQSLHLESNYFTGEITYSFLYNHIEPLNDGSDENNCLDGDTSYTQRSQQECVQFCNSTAPEGACAGHGICSFNTSTGLPTCLCDKGYKKIGDNLATCTPPQASLLQAIASGWTINGTAASTVLNWTSSDACDGSYSGVRCDSGTVTSLVLDKSRLSGGIPDSLWTLTNLTQLDLGSNQLFGSIPDSLGKLTSLTRLNLSRNQLSGNIPESLENVVYLENLDLSFNQLSGSIPDFLGNMSHLLKVYLDHNYFTGGLDYSILKQRVQSLVEWSDAENCLVGVNFTQRSQQECSQFCNTTAPEGPCGGLGTCYFNSTNGIPSCLCDKWSKQADDNPAACNPTQASLLHSVASAWTINGQDASSALGWTSLDPCDGSYTGVGCQSGAVTSLVLYFQQLSGSIPESLGKLTDLQWLGLGTNQLYGSIPDSLGNLVSLQNWVLDNNQFSGSIPDSLGKLTNLTGLYLHVNQLTGSIPSSLQNLNQLQELYLWSNQLSGGIPDSLGRLTSLQKLELNNNQLSGRIPLSLENLTRLQSLHLESNFFTGEITYYFLYIHIKPLNDGSDENNCLDGDTLYTQRSQQECAHFCNTTATEGACAGHGICSFDTTTGLPSCMCDNGYNHAWDNLATCMREEVF